MSGPYRDYLNAHQRRLPVPAAVRQLLAEYDGARVSLGVLMAA